MFSIGVLRMQVFENVAGLRISASVVGAADAGGRELMVSGRETGNGTGPILTRWEVFDNLWACLVPQESLRAEWCFMFSTGVLRMQVFEKAGDYEAFVGGG